MKRLSVFLHSDWAFYIPVGLFVLAVTWVAASSLYPMAFDEEFHLGLIKIYATSWLPYGIQHTSDMAQFGAATADPSYLFHYLMSFPYRLLAGVGLPDMAIIIVLRVLNLGFVVAALLVFQKAMLRASISKPMVNASLWLFTLVPVFIMLAAQINYDNLLLLVVAWSFYLVITMTKHVVKTGLLPLSTTWLLIIAVLIGISIKYAYLPIALALFVWSVGLMIVTFRRQKKSLTHFIRIQLGQFLTLPRRTRYGLIGLTVVSLFFASHYIVNHVTYGHAIPACDQVFSEDECTAYGPWNRNRNYIAARDPSFEPLSYPAYMVIEWVPGMTERLTFSLAGKTNGFQTKLPLPVVIIGYVLLTAIGAACFAYQAFRRNVSWFGWLTLLTTGIYVGVLSLQLYDDYVTTAQPVAINGRYLILLLPLVGVVFMQAINNTFRNIPRSLKSTICLGAIAVLLVGGAGASTYILQSETHWYWPGFGQSTHHLFKTVLSFVTLPFRF